MKLRLIFTLLLIVLLLSGISHAQNEGEGTSTEEPTIDQEKYEDYVETMLDETSPDKLVGMVRKNPDYYEKYISEKPDYVTEHPELFEVALETKPELMKESALAQNYIEGATTKKGTAVKMQSVDSGSITSFDTKTGTFTTKEGMTFTMDHLVHLKNEGYGKFTITDFGLSFHSDQGKYELMKGKASVDNNGNFILTGGTITSTVRGPITKIGAITVQEEGQQEFILGNSGKATINADGSIRLEGKEIKFGPPDNINTLNTGIVTFHSNEHFTFEATDDAPTTVTLNTKQKITVTKTTDFHTTMEGYATQLKPDNPRFQHSVIWNDKDFKIITVISKEKNSINIEVTDSDTKLVDIDSSHGTVEVVDGQNTLFSRKNKITSMSRFNTPLSVSVRTADGYYVSGGEKLAVGRCTDGMCTTTIKTIFVARAISYMDAEEATEFISLIVKGAEIDELKKEEAVHILRGMLEYPNTKITANAAKGLALIPGHASLLALASGLENENFETQLRIFNAIGSEKRTDAFPLLKRYYEEDKDPKVQFSAVQAMANLRIPEAQTTLSKIALDPNMDFKLRTSAIPGITEIPVLNRIALNKHELSSIRLKAAETLLDVSPDKPQDKAQAIIYIKEIINTPPSKLSTPIDQALAIDLLVSETGPESFSFLEKVFHDSSIPTSTQVHALRQMGSFADQGEEYTLAIVDIAKSNPELSNIAYFELRKYRGELNADIFLSQDTTTTQTDSKNLAEKNNLFEQYRPEIKDQYFLHQTSKEDLIINRDEIEDQINSRLSEVGNTKRSDARNDPYSESFEDQKDKLNTVELNKINFLLTQLDSESVINQIGRIIKADLGTDKPSNLETLDGVKNDGTRGSFSFDPDRTEMGGVVSINDGKADFVPYQPRICDNNHCYKPSEKKLIDNIAQAAFSFHLHATQEDDSRYSGPSSGGNGAHADRGVARSQQYDGVVITSLGQGRFNVDYYTPDGEVIDLGNYEPGLKITLWKPPNWENSEEIGGY